VTGFNVNSGDARVWGWEATSDIAITDNLTGRLTAAWTDSQLKNARMDTFSLFPDLYTDDPSCTPEAIQAIPDPSPEDESNNINEAQDKKAVECQKISGDVSGNTQMRQPEWTASASLSYRRQLTGEWSWFTRADANYVGKIYIGNDNMGWLRPRTNVNFRLGAESPRYSLEFWVRNLLNDDNPIAAFRDIFWTNNGDIQNQQRFAGGDAETAARRSNFDDFPPWRLSVNYPALRSYGIVGKVRFGGAEK
jgi:outer membrane receptor protein involved in Fe transport